METITRIILLGLLASVAYLVYRLDSQATAHAEATAAVQAEREANLAQLQTLERQHAERISEIEVAAQGKLEKVNRDAATARRAADGLRGQLADFAKRGAATGASTATGCTADQGRIDLLAEVLTGNTHTAEHVSATLTDAGFPVSASTIRTYRRSLRQKEKR